MRPTPRPLGGNLTDVGEQVGAASAPDCAILSLVFGALLGAIHGARICEVEGLHVDEFGAMLAGLVPVFLCLRPGFLPKASRLASEARIWPPSSRSCAPTPDKAMKLTVASGARQLVGRALGGVRDAFRF